MRLVLVLHDEALPFQVFDGALEAAAALQVLFQFLDSVPDGVGDKLAAGAIPEVFHGHEAVHLLQERHGDLDAGVVGAHRTRTGGSYLRPFDRNPDPSPETPKMSTQVRHL